VSAGALSWSHHKEKLLQPASHQCPATPPGSTSRGCREGASPNSHQVLQLAGPNAMASTDRSGMRSPGGEMRGSATLAWYIRLFSSPKPEDAFLGTTGPRAGRLGRT
jgi:hypothetical protein